MIFPIKIFYRRTCNHSVSAPEYGMQLHGGHSYCQTLHAEIAGEMFCDLFVSAGRGRAGYWKNYTGILKGYQAFKERGTSKGRVWVINGSGT